MKTKNTDIANRKRKHWTSWVQQSHVQFQAAYLTVLQKVIN